jgi:hypothetical protein
VGELAIQADVYRADDAEVRPVLVWIHGGALIMGSRGSVPKNLLDLCRADGVVLVSLDYRLAPEAKLPAIISDIEDAFRWLREQGPRLFQIDPDMEGLGKVGPSPFLRAWIERNGFHSGFIRDPLYQQCGRRAVRPSAGQAGQLEVGHGEHQIRRRCVWHNGQRC